MAVIDGVFGHFGDSVAEQGDSGRIILRIRVSISENHISGQIRGSLTRRDSDRSEQGIPLGLTRRFCGYWVITDPNS